MTDSEKFANCRIIDKEIEYIDRYWNGSFSDYVHNSIKRDLKELETAEKNRKLQVFKEFSLYVVIMALGTICFMIGLQTPISIAMALSYVTGLFLIVFGTAGGLLVALHSTK